MNILAIETGTTQGSIALCDNNILVEEIFFKTNENFGQNIFQYIKQLLSSNSLTIKDVDLIAVNHGPGSYTGLRIGVTCANTLSWVNKIPIIGVSALFSIVVNSKDTNTGSIVSIIYSNAKDAFFAHYKYNNNGWSTIKKDQKIQWTELPELISNEKNITYYGNKPFPLNLNNSIDITEWQPKAENIGISAFISSNTDKTFGNIQPNYLKDFEVTPKKE